MSIVLENLSKRYGRQTVVKHVSIEIADGELFVLLGASGSGKSTILRMIAGLVDCDEGKVVVKGRDVTHLAPQPRGTGFVFQNYSIFRHMTVAENIEFGLRIRKVPAAERTRRCDELLDLVGLAGYGDRYANQLSGGQQQRVALARALAYEPSVLLLDEPLGALDAKIRTQLRRSLKEIQRRLKVTTLLVTHDQEEAYELADRIGVMEQGTLLEVGPAEELYAHPKTLYVASFLGGGTVLGGRAAGGLARFGHVAVPIPPQVPHEEGASVELLFRPEEVELTEKEPRTDKPVLGKAEVVEQTFSGAIRRVRLRLPRLAGTRQVSPTVVFGEAGLIVEAMLPADIGISAKEVWVSLRDWTILAQSPPTILMVDAGKEAQALLALTRTIAKAMDATITILADASDQKGEDVRKEVDERVRGAGLEEMQVVTATGDLNQQLSAQSANTLYDLVIVPRQLKSPKGGVDQVVTSFLEHAEIPTIITGNTPKETISRVLLCTRAGEPGKSDILVGGRLAHFLNAAVTLLHVIRPGTRAPTIVKRHLEQASSTLRGLELESQVSIMEHGDPAAAILEASKDHDLLVIGGPGWSSKSIFGRDDITFRVVSGAKCPVLIVPVES